MEERKFFKIGENIFTKLKIVSSMNKRKADKLWQKDFNIRTDTWLIGSTADGKERLI